MLVPRVLIEGFLWSSLFSLVMATAGCSDGAPNETAGSAPAKPPVVQDSAGIRVVEHFFGWAPDEHWQVESEPALTIGSADGDASFVLSHVRGAAILNDDRLVIGDGATGQIRYFSLDGDHLRSVGGKGGGPKEFQHLMLLGSRDGDSVYVADPVLRKVVVLDRDGELARTSWFANEFGAANPLGVLATGLVVLERLNGPGTSPMEGVRRRPNLIRVSDWNSELLWELGPLPGNETASLEGASGPIPFGRGLLVGSGRDQLAVGTNDAFRIRVYDADGALGHIIAFQIDPPPVQTGDFDRFMKRTLAPHADENFRRRIRAAAEQMPKRKTHPLFHDLKMGPDGEIWVRRGGDSERPTQSWYVFDSTGRMIAEATLPAGAQLLDVERDRVLLLQRDELFVERVQLHPITRTGRSPS